jgi:hypothetical protein
MPGPRLCSIYGENDHHRRFQESAVDRLAVLRLLSGRSAMSKRQEANNLARIWANGPPLGRHARPA